MKHILLAEDDIDYAGILKQYLELSGFQVTWAKDGAEAFVIVGPAQPDICVLDVMMPEMDGYETIRNIREMQKFTELPIIALTAKAMKGDREKCIEAGASDYISKPVNVDQLLSLIRVWLYQ